MGLTQEDACETQMTWTKSQRNVVIAAYLGSHKERATDAA